MFWRGSGAVPAGVVVRVVGEFRRLAGSKAAPVVNQDKLVVLDLVAFLSVQLAVVAAVE
jgi:hypothetical protein